MTALAHMFKGLSGQFELGRVLWAAFSIGFIVYAGIDMLALHNAFNPVNYGVGAGSIMAAGGFGLAQKDKGVASAAATTASTPPPPSEGG